MDRYPVQEVDDWTATRPLHASLLKGDFLPICEKARKNGVAPQNIRPAWAEWGMYAFNRVRVMSNPEWPLLFRARPESPPPRDGPGQNPQNLRATTPIAHEEARSQIDALGSAAQKPEADLAVAKAVLHRPLTREKPAERSLVILSKSRYMTQAGLEGARLTTRKRSPKTQQRKRHLGGPIRTTGNGQRQRHSCRR